MNQLSFFNESSASNNIVPFNRNPVEIEPWMILLVDYMTDALSSTQFQKCMEIIFNEDNE